MKKRTIIPFGLFLMILLGAATVSAQKENDVATREITSLDFQNQRQKPENGEKRVNSAVQKNATPKQRKNLAVITNTRRRYNLVRRVPPKTNVAAKIDKPATNSKKPAVKSEQIGVTFWRLRPVAADDGDDVPFFSVRLGDARENWTAERVNSTTRFKEGDRVRISIESSRTGYLYIINREYYTDGTAGAANIIFPTLRTRGGENRVVAGSLVDVPASTDSVPYFTIKPKRRDYAGEELIVLITNEKLPLEIGMKALALNTAQFEKWSNDWSATVDIYDAEDGEGIAMTSAELSVAQNPTRSLEQEEPLPQTIYKVRISSDLPLLVPFRMSAVVQ
jgi:hypothetical protein